MTTKVELPFDGFYESIHDSMIDDAILGHFQDDHGDMPADWDGDEMYMADVDYRKLQSDYCEAYVALFAEEYELTLTFDEMTSPREYNFSSDRLFVTIPREQIDKIRAEVYADGDWQNTVNDNFTSYDGFASFYPTDLTAEEWTRDVLDECQYKIVLEHWLDMKHRDDPNNNHERREVEYQLASDIEIYSLAGYGDAIDAIELYITNRNAREAK